MPNGRDSKIITKFTPNHFLLTPEIQKQNHDIKKYPGLPKGAFDNPRYTQTPPKALVEALDEGLRYMLSKRKDAVEDRFGKGSSDWILNNLNSFTAEERYRLHEMFNQMQSNRVNGEIFPHKGEPIRTTQPIIGRQG